MAGQETGDVLCSGMSDLEAKGQEPEMQQLKR